MVRHMNAGTFLATLNAVQPCGRQFRNQQSWGEGVPDRWCTGWGSWREPLLYLAPRLKFSVLLESLRCSKAHGSAGDAGENLVYDSEIPRREGTISQGPNGEWGVPKVRSEAGGEWELWARACTVVSMGRAGQGKQAQGLQVWMTAVGSGT